MTFRHILFCASALFLAFPVLAEEKTYSETSPVRHAVIFDMDMGNDVDDALALAMLYRYVDVRKGGSTWCHGEKLPSAVAIYRRLLAGQSDHSVTIASVGFLTNLAALLDSGADDFSPLSGRELVAKKVKLVSVMAGNISFEDGRDIFPEYNVRRDIASAKKFFSECPVPVVVSTFELGLEICYPVSEIEANLGFGTPNPVVEAYKAYMPMPYDRPTWDLTSVIYAVEGNEWFTSYSTGTVSVDDNGLFRFVPSQDGLHFVLRVAPESRRDFLRHLVELTDSRFWNM